MCTSADRYSTSQSTIPPRQPRARNDERSSRLERAFIVTPDDRATNSAMKRTDPSGRVVDVVGAFRTTQAQGLQICPRIFSRKRRSVFRRCARKGNGSYQEGKRR